MLCTPGEVLERRAAGLAEAIKAAAPKADAGVVEAVGYLGSGSLPTEQLAGLAVAVTVNGMKAADLAERLRTNEACVFTRIEGQRVLMDVRTLTDNQVPLIAAAMRQIAG